ncbi:ABC transporter substrate-binding protein [Piscinibacter gummiphilus]|uniref:Uncharacterized protein n=1 Tax=Piscinibacter gummiphilus TaxID=946333 RepID=A0A1W6L6L7_9BURK|nr:ABC transporter substrate-binding protein [Piscinibacter gummiphilus]ARN19846.1 hypothetical protein A4W93_07925 [Piscinibacter gummiphilus]GLS95073.1 hypothetical protein GCM10007918_23650 [Piscinibacter gummiphilus]
MAVLVSLAVLAAIRLGLSGAAGPGVPMPHARLTIAVPSTPHAALLHIAAAEGHFVAEGLDVTFKRVTHGKAALDLVLAGEADLATAAEVPFVIAVLKGERLGVAASVASASEEMAVVARHDRGIAGPRDLTGKRVGVSLGTSGEYFLWAFLIRNRLPPGAITWVDVPPRRIVEELTEGGVDAIATWEPLRAGAMAALGNNGALFPEGDAYTVTHLVVGRIEWMQAQPETMARLVRALLRAEGMVHADPGRARAVLAAALDLPLERLAPVWGGLTLRVDLRQSQLVTLEDESRWAMARGHAPAGPLPDFLRQLHLDTLLAVAPDRVTVVR